MKKLFYSLRLDFLIISIVLIIKSIFFYDMTENNLSIFLIILYSSIYFITIFGILNLLPILFSRICLVLSYIFISILMFVDSLYYLHFGNLTSVSLIYQLKVIDDISGSISELINFNHKLLLIDIPFIIGTILFLYFKDYNYISDFSKNNLYKRNSIIKSAIIPFIFIIFIVTSSGMVESSPLVINSFQREYFSYHVKDIYKNYLASDKLKYKEKDVDNYFSKHISEESKISNDSKYFGIASGKNVINIQMESISEFLITNQYDNQFIMPNLNSLLNKDTIYFDNYYQQIGKGGTSDAEFTTLTSQYPSSKDATLTYFYKNDFYSLPNILKKNGYEKTMGFHGYDGNFWNRKNAYPSLGIDNFYDRDFFKSSKKTGWGIGDEEMFQQTIPVYEDLKNPFFAQIVTLSTHHPFDIPAENVLFEDFKLKEEHVGTTFGNYLLAAHYLDKFIGEYIESLKKNGIYENTVFTFYGDHFILNKTDKESSGFISKELLNGKPYEEDTVYKVPLLVHIPDSNINETVSNLGSFIDYTPTMLYLLGIENPMKVYFGKNILFENSNVILDRSYLPNSIITSDIVYIEKKGYEGYEETRLWDKLTREKLNLDSYKNLIEKETDVYNISDYIFKKNYIKKYLK